jgi:hypothetical protein
MPSLSFLQTIYSALNGNKPFNSKLMINCQSIYQARIMYALGHVSIKLLWSQQLLIIKFFFQEVVVFQSHLTNQMFKKSIDQ